ncbi:related to chaperone protein DNAJ [Cephalotrichum gorgonifer]|uniref:Related to chaperone protein DNAJ n=1 Tax=Cephalotrichum gorgonifer TaxID=2041049 RepID=A0AAE8T013_9PEZI|nr:related to chaperone protein DNAJ [Cephalotrichum gorgonifer]
MSGTLSLMGWWFLPNLVASWTQSIWYSLTIRAGDPKPVPGTPRHATHRRRIQVLVISLYLLYTLYEAAYDLRLAGNYYSDLSLPLSASDREIKSRFRRLAAVYHPDKAGDGSDGSEFMRLKIAADVLSNDAARFAYERFGPAIAGWRDCASRYEYVLRGTAKGIVPHYLSYAAALYVMGFVGYLDFARYWRWFFLAAMAVFELHVATRPSSPFLDLLNPVLASPLIAQPPLVQFQLVSFARRCCVTLYIALSQIGPLLFPPRPDRDADQGGKALAAQMDKISAMAVDADRSATRLLDIELAPYRGDDGLMAQVRGKIAEWLVQNTIRADPMVKDAMGTTLRRRRVDAPAGARGNR